MLIFNLLLAVGHREKLETYRSEIAFTCAELLGPMWPAGLVV